MSAALSFAFPDEPERTRVVFEVQGDEGKATFECVVCHHGANVARVSFPQDWRDLLTDAGLDPFEVDCEQLLCRLAEKAFAKLPKTSTESTR
jgi:hypothetical protein